MDKELSNMSNTKATLPGMPVHEDDRPWWKYPMVWMVIGGPLAVVVACIITWFVIMQSPNEVLNTLDDAENHTLSASGTQYSPAMRARNHAATGGGDNQQH